MIRVMIVEDDPMVAHINTEYINRVENFQVVKHVSNGIEALNYLKSGAKIDLIMLVSVLIFTVIGSYIASLVPNTASL